MDKERVKKITTRLETLRYIEEVASDAENRGREGAASFLRETGVKWVLNATQLPKEPEQKKRNGRGEE